MELEKLKCDLQNPTGLKRLSSFSTSYIGFHY